VLGEDLALGGVVPGYPKRPPVAIYGRRYAVLGVGLKIGCIIRDRLTGALGGGGAWEFGCLAALRNSYHAGQLFNRCGLGDVIERSIEAGEVGSAL
jgi:hypothetical protein